MNGYKGKISAFTAALPKHKLPIGAFLPWFSWRIPGPFPRAGVGLPPLSFFRPQRAVEGRGASAGRSRPSRSPNSGR